MSKKTYKAHGKCILLGEHSVIRSHPAIVLPLYTKSISLTPTNLVKNDDFHEPIEKCLKALSQITKQKNPEQNFAVESNIPIRAGLGSSAALSVALVHWWNENISPINDLFQTALELENIFHGRSSGLDIAASLSDKPILFQVGKIQEQFSKLPGFFSLHDSDERSSTKDCVIQVEKINRVELDEKMRSAVFLGKKAIEELNVNILAEAIEMAHQCFESWNLVSTKMAALRNRLLSQGALAVKPTGSGSGGYMLALWKEEKETKSFSFM